jgi:diguanylate cyclase (GGDEF)-like protein
VTAAYTRWPGWVWYLVGCVTAIGMYFAVPWDLAKIGLYAALGVSSALATVVGVHRNRPPVVWPWYLMALGRLSFTGGDVTYWWQTMVDHHDAFPTYSDALYLAYYPALVAALLGLVRARQPGKDRPGLLDALILSTGTAMLAWVFLIVPYVRATDLSLMARVVSLAYPVADLMVLSVLLRLTTGRADRTRAYQLLVASTCAMLVGDVVYALLELSIGYQPGNIVDATWLAMYALVGAAALHPSMVAMSRSAASAAEGQVSRGRLVALASASLMAPAMLAIEWLRHMPIDVPLVVTGCTVLFLLVIARLHGLLALVSRTLRTVEEQATHDQLTGLANRRLFHHRWQHSLATAGGPTALLYVDLDGFKLVNDSLGHEAGDDLLVQVADRLRQLARQGDVVARLGGDEFAIILPWTDEPTASQVAARLVAALGEPFHFNHRPISIGASVGVVTAPPGGDPQSQLRRADAAMYSAKAAGRGRAHAG